MKPGPLKSLGIEEISPSLEELRKFQNVNVDDDADEPAEIITHMVKPKVPWEPWDYGWAVYGVPSYFCGLWQVVFQRGDIVKVIEGDLKHLMGVVESVDSGKVTMMPNHPDLTEELEFDAENLIKHFKTGDHVKILSGPKEGVTGMVVKVDGTLVFVWSDVLQEEIQVLSHDLEHCTDIGAGVNVVGMYELQDLVQLNTAGGNAHNSVGVLVKLDTNAFTVLDTLGQIRSVKPQEVSTKRKSMGSTALDGHQNQVTVNDVIKVTESEHRGLQGTIKHIFRSFVFAHSRQRIEHGGIFVVRSRQCALVGGQPRADSGNDWTGPSNVLRSPGPMGDRPMFSKKGGKGGGKVGGKGKGKFGRNSKIGETCRIGKGQWKGYTSGGTCLKVTDSRVLSVCRYAGIVREVNSNTCRVGLHTNAKLITVQMADLMFGVDAASARPGNQSERSSNDGSQTPWRRDGGSWGGMTPRGTHGSRALNKELPICWNPHTMSGKCICK